MESSNNQTTYLVVDGENIDATLGLSVLDRRPNPEERPRWDRVLECAHGRWNQRAKGLFFLNGSSGFLPMGFVQALTAMDYSGDSPVGSRRHEGRRRRPAAHDGRDCTAWLG